MDKLRDLISDFTSSIEDCRVREGDSTGNDSEVDYAIAELDKIHTLADSIEDRINLVIKAVSELEKSDYFSELVDDIKEPAKEIGEITY